MTDEDRYLSVQDLATYSALSVRTLVRYINAKTNPIPHYRIGGRVLVKRSDFDRWIETVGTPDHVVKARTMADKVQVAVDGLRGRRR